MQHVMLLKNIVAAGLAKKCEVQIAYAIGVARPVSIMVETFGTSSYSNDQLAEAVNQVFDLRPTSIIETLELRKPIYRNLAAYGHMGREDLNVSWEKTDKVEALRNALCERKTRHLTCFFIFGRFTQNIL